MIRVWVHLNGSVIIQEADFELNFVRDPDLQFGTLGPFVFNYGDEKIVRLPRNWVAV